MNLETVLKCANITVQVQMNAFGHVTKDVQDLIDELNSPAPAAEEVPAVKPKAKAKAAE